jgi:tetratricopeptide (TPR) repeat protein
MFLGAGAEAAESASRAIAEATRCGDHGTLGKVYYVLAQQGALAGRMPEGIEYGRRAVELLERTGEQWWIGPAYWAIGLNHALRGEFDLAREAEARATAIAEEVGDPELQSCAAWATGVIQAASGQADLAVETCTRALERAPDPLNSAIAAGWLGFAHLEAGAATAAIPTLERSVELLGQFRFPQLEGQFTVFLAEAHRVAGRSEVARALGRRGLELCRGSNAPYGTACAERALGRLAAADGDARAASGHFTEALRRFAEIGARYDLARTHADLGALAAESRDAAGAARHLGEAARLLRELDLPRHLARLGELAARLGLPDPTALA